MQISTNPRRQVPPSGQPGPDPEHRQRKRLLLALVLLLAAISVVLVKNRHYLSREDAETGQNAVENAPPESAGSTGAALAKPGTVKPAKSAKATKRPPASAPAGPAATITPSVNRTSLPPLRVEVYAGDKVVRVKPEGPEQVHVDTSAGTKGRAAPEESVPTSASQRVQIAPETLNVLSNPVDPNYPLLAREMKVQGSVVLQAFIGRDGIIQELHVVSGPGILASAAMEAVRQWRFKPYFENGEAVETQARITVNFTISTTS